MMATGVVDSCVYLLCYPKHMSEDKVVGIVTRSHRNDQWSVRQMMEDAIQDDEQHPEFTKAMVLRLNTQNEGYETGWAAVDMSCSEMLALLEVVKQVILREMDY